MFQRTLFALQNNPSRAHSSIARQPSELQRDDATHARLRLEPARLAAKRLLGGTSLPSSRMLGARAPHGYAWDMPDPYDLQRFIDAQDPIYQQVLGELSAGTKRSHWMWFVFPQLRGLGRSERAQQYGIASKVEAEAYWEHPLLRARLIECMQLVLVVRGKSALDIFGSPDEAKFRSCVTLFAEVDPSQEVFQQALIKYFGGVEDFKTLELLGR